MFGREGVIHVSLCGGEKREYHHVIETGLIVFVEERKGGGITCV